MDELLDRKLRDVVARDEIWRMMQRYACGIDRLDREKEPSDAGRSVR